MKSRFGFALAALVMAAAIAHADDGEKSRGAAREEGRGRRDEAFRIVDAYVISHLQESLGLSDEQYAKVLPLVTKLQGDRRDNIIGRGRLTREMRRLLRAGGASEARSS